MTGINIMLDETYDQYSCEVAIVLVQKRGTIYHAFLQLPFGYEKRNMSAKVFEQILISSFTAFGAEVVGSSEDWEDIAPKFTQPLPGYHFVDHFICKDGDYQYEEVMLENGDEVSVEQTFISKDSKGTLQCGPYLIAHTVGDGT
jgi:hypothetical protein